MSGNPGKRDSRPPNQPQGYQSNQSQVPRPIPPLPSSPYSSDPPRQHPAYGSEPPRNWGPPPPSPYAENQPAGQRILGNPQQLASRRRVQEGVAADQPNTGQAQAHAPVSSDMVLGSTPLDPEWKPEQLARMTACKEKDKNARWEMISDVAGGDHGPLECRKQWRKMQRDAKKEEDEGEEGKGKGPKRDRGPDSEDKEDRGGPRQRQRR